MAVPKIYVLERKYEKYVYPFIPQFYYIKVGFRAVYGYVMLMRLIVAQTNYCVFPFYRHLINSVYIYGQKDMHVSYCTKNKHSNNYFLKSVLFREVTLFSEFSHKARG